KEAELAYYAARNVKEKVASCRNEITTIEAKMANVTYDEKCLLEGANVICTTLNSCCALSSKISRMDVCIIDEATQCNEPTSLIPLQFGVKSLILVGDTKQLPSTVVSEIAKQYNYDQSLFQRLQKSYESTKELENPILQLTTQYRMHPDILHWPNEYFYKNCLQSDESIKKITFPLKPYTVFNLNFSQTAHTGQKHISNVNEAKFVRNLLNFLVTKADPKLNSYGIISAYSQQKDDLSKDLNQSHPYVSVNTIDSCQGQERDIVIISIARTRGIGFLAIKQRLNVALTRAKKMLILCGNFDSLQNHPMWTSLLDDARKRKMYVQLPTVNDDSLFTYF
ncbi:Helicase sen1, partial [Pseudolycoriella hygida]